MSKNQKIVVENNFQKPIILCIEPWATEYGMMPSDVFEIVPEDEETDVYFHLAFGDGRITVYVEGKRASYPQVLQDGEELEFRHNLR